MKRQRELGCVFLLVALAIAGCGDAGGNTAARHGGPSATASPSGSAGAALQKRLLTGTAAVRTAHVSFRFGPVQPNGQPDDSEPVLTADGTGVESLAGGRVQSVDLAGHVVPEFRSRIVGAGDQLYVQLPPELNRAPKPWTLVSRTSANETVSVLTPRLRGETSFGAPYLWTTMAGHAAQVSTVGTDRIGNTNATHYRLTVPTKAFPGLDGKDSSTASTTFPVDLWTDPQNRPVKAIVLFGSGNAVMSLTVMLGAFDAPVSITLPPLSEINAG